MKLNLNTQKLTDALVRLEQACDTMPQLAEKARGEALGYAVISSDMNIYWTPAGKYVRTGQYRQGIDARARATRNTATVTVLNEVEYAAFVERGRDGLSLPMLQVMALMQGGSPDPLTLGRSGVNWTIAAPVVTGAQAYAFYRLRELFSKAVREAVSRS